MFQRKRKRFAAALSAAGAATAALTGAHAQTSVAEAEEAVYLEADQVINEERGGRYIARGNVQARYGGRTLSADEVLFMPEQGRVIARGNVTILEDGGAVTFADEAELSDDLSSGVIVNFSARLPSDATIGARVATQSADNTVRFTRAFYTPCTPCAERGFGARPTWRLKARKVTRDGPNDMVFYRDAVLEVKGVPVLYTPFFAHADPSVGRKSGLLLPNFGESSRTGGFYSQPYYWVLSDSADLTLAPQLMENADPLIGFEYRKRFFSGNVLISGSATREQEFANFDDDDDPNTPEVFTKFGEDQLRGHLFGDGVFAVNENWLWGFGAEAILNEDDTYLQRYEIDGVDSRRGLYRRDARRLMSQLYSVRQTEDSYFSVAALDFQSLRVPASGQIDEEDTFPLVLPFAEARKAFRARFLGGRAEARLSAVALERNPPQELAFETGLDYRRMTLETEWNRRITTKGGIVIEPQALARGDLYSLSDVPVTDTDTANGLQDESVDDETVVRALGYVAATASYPVGRRMGSAHVELSPIANVTLASTGDNDENIVNQDSLSVDLDEANILLANRSPGFDVWEEGARATVGGRASVRWGPAQEASLFVAQSYRADDFTDFEPIEDANGDLVDATGLAGDVTDVVAAGALSLGVRNAITARVRLDDEDYEVQRLDVDARIGVGPISAYGRYLQVQERVRVNNPDTDERESLDFGGEVRLNKNFAVRYNANRDLADGETRRSDLTLVYRDNCTQVELIYKEENFPDDPSIGTEESISVRFTLATLGGFVTK